MLAVPRSDNLSRRALQALSSDSENYQVHQRLYLSYREDCPEKAAHHLEIARRCWKGTPEEFEEALEADALALEQAKRRAEDSKEHDASLQGKKLGAR